MAWDPPYWLRLAVYALGGATALVCAWFVARSARRLKRRIAEFEAELEARQGAPLDPYSALAEIYAEQTQPRSPRRRARARRQ
jgi:hypothetical protein